VPLAAYLTLAALVFAIGLFGVLTRRNAVGILLGIELMLNAVNINLVAFARFQGALAGMVFTIFTICITVAEVALGLALSIGLYIDSGWDLLLLIGLLPLFFGLALILIYVLTHEEQAQPSAIEPTVMPDDEEPKQS